MSVAKPMTSLRALELVRTTSPQDISTEDLAALRKLFHEVPSLCAALGGVEHMERYLMAAEVAAAPKTAITVPQTTSEPPADLTLQTPRNRLSGRRIAEIGLAAVLLATVGWWSISTLLPLNGNSRTTPPTAGEVPPTSPRSRDAAKAATASPEAVTTKSVPAVLSSGNNSSAAPASVGSPTVAGALAAADAKPLAVTERPKSWQGWNLEADASSRLELQTGWDLTDPSNPRPTKWLVASGGAVTLSRQMIVPADARSLNIQCRQLAAATAGDIELLIDGKKIGHGNVPADASACSVRLNPAEMSGRALMVRLIYSPRDASEQVQWQKIEFSPESSEVVTFGEPDAAFAGLRLWLRADRGVKDVAGRGPDDKAFDGFVQQWLDQSKNHFQIACAGGDATRRPAFVAHLPQLAGQPALRFDGENDALLHNGDALYDGQSATTFIVFELTAVPHGTQVSRNMTLLDTSAPRRYLAVESRWRNVLRHWVHTGGPEDITGWEPDKDGRFVIAVWQTNGAQSVLGVNGHRTGGVQAGGRSGDSFAIGSRTTLQAAFGGHLAELMVFNQAMSDADARRIGQYLQSKYGIASQY